MRVNTPRFCDEANQHIMDCPACRTALLIVGLHARAINQLETRGRCD